MIEPQLAASRANRKSRWVVLLHALTAVVALAIFGGLAVGVRHVWRAYQFTSERDQAFQQLKVHGYGWASEAFKRLAERDDRDVEVIRQIGLGAFQLYFLADAEKYLTRWCELEPAAAEPHLLRLRLMRKLGRVDEALAEGTTLVDIAPDDLDVQKVVIALLVQARHYRDAEGHCRRLLPRYPGHNGLRTSLAECCHADGRDDEARALLDAVLKDDAMDPDALALRGLLAFDAGQYAEAVPFLRRAVAEDALRSEPRYYLSLALARTGQPVDADAEMAEAQRLARAEQVIEDAQFQPENLDLRCEAAKFLIERGRADEAAPLLADVMARHHTYEPAMRVLFSKELANYQQTRRRR